VAICLLGALLCAEACLALPQSTEATSQASLERQINASLSQGRGTLAAESLDKLLNEPHLDSGVLLRTGIAFAQSALFPEAVRAFTRCVRDYPTVFEGHYDLALAELAGGHLTQAYAAIDHAPHQSEQESTARMYLRGKIEAGLGRMQLAQKDLSAAFEKDPGRENFALDLGLLYLETHAYPQSERVFAQSSALNLHSTYLLLGLALAQFLDGRTSQSVEASKRLLAASPDFSPARLLLGFTLYFDGNFTEAREVARAGLKLPDPDPYLYYLEAATLLKQHGREQAQILDDLSVAERRIPNCALCYVASSKVHEEQNELQLALADLEKAVRLAPDLSEGWYHLAAVYSRLGEAAEAAKAREHFQAMKANADEREKQMMQGVLLESLGAQSHATPR
jgi:tetratricopeptide (TPR) repeat protein